MAILISDKYKNISKKRKGQRGILYKILYSDRLYGDEWIDQSTKKAIILIVYEPNNRATEYAKQKLKELK